MAKRVRDHVAEARRPAQLAKTRERARYVLQLLRARPSMLYQERLEAVRQKFGCGKTAAEQAHALANEQDTANLQEYIKNARERTAAGMLEDAEEARRAGDFRAAAAIRERVARFNGVGVADKFEVSGKLAIESATPAELEKQMGEDQRALARAARRLLGDDVLEGETNGHSKAS